MVVKHVVGFQSSPVETFSFLLTLLATTVTPVFVLSKRWTHLPCGCIINCRQSAYSVASDGEKSKSSAWCRAQDVCTQMQKSALMREMPQWRTKPEGK
jgi:hypothetical protein